MMNEKNFLAWAIDLNTNEGHGFAGRYFWANPLPEHLEGCVTALFKTRAIARRQLIYARQGNVFANARVVRVEVTIKRKGYG
jgi:hypothetical protein